jgi:plastocyanin
MTDVGQPDCKVRREVLRVALGAGVGVIARLAVGASRAADGSQITIHSFAFTPQTLTVDMGTTVTWTNQDETIHSIVCPELKLRSNPLDTNDSFNYVFRKAGTYDYICGVHPYMKGQVVVRG